MPLPSLNVRSDWLPLGKSVDVLEAAPAPPFTVNLTRAFEPPTNDQALWMLIRQTTEALSFRNYNAFMDGILCADQPGEPGFTETERQAKRRALPFPDVDAYRVLKVATEVFMKVGCGVLVKDQEDGFPFTIEPQEEVLRLYRRPTRGEINVIWRRYLDSIPLNNNNDEVLTLPYLELVRENLTGVGILDSSRAQHPDLVRICEAIIRDKLTNPCLLELIWSYWHEEGMLVQTMKAIARRFQNRRGPAERDPLALLEIDPLRPLSNLIWGYIQDEQHRLTVPRRAYEYDHHYGITLFGKAVPRVRGADSRPRFIEAFHTLLYLCSIFYKEDDDTTVVADGFPILNALREVHLLLTQGAHNQFGDLPWTSRQEMLMEEWLLARPEFREYLPRRIMVDYPEPWMQSVETMKTLQGWTDTSVLHFRDLGVFGERILLSIRFRDWTSEIHPESAANWARYWRAEVQGYVHGYRTVAGVDLSDRPDATMPALLLRQRLPQRAVPAGLPAAARQALPAAARQALPAPERRQLPRSAPRPGMAELPEHELTQ